MSLAVTGLTPVGTVHTAISLVAVLAGLLALLRDRAILPATPLGNIYGITTVLTCITGFGIYQNGGFGAPNVLGIITLVVLGIAWRADRAKPFGRLSPYIATVGMSATFFFHMIPGVAETATRLPVGAPWAESNESPGVQKIVGALFVVFLIGATAQVVHLRAKSATTLHARPTAR